jgi:hypothetical protein
VVPLYFLDRNAVALIKRNNAGRVEVDQKKAKFLGAISALDRRGTHVTPLLSIIEGERGRDSSIEETRECIEKESAALKQFFRVATTDSEYLMENIDSVAATLASFKEKDWDRRGALLEAARPLFGGGGQLSEDNFGVVEAAVLELVEKHGLRSDDPISVLLLAALYHSVPARRALKLNGRWKGPHNPLSDVHAISRMAYVHAVGATVDRNVSPVFISLDEDISFIMGNIAIKNATVDGEGDLRMDIGYKRRLFPALNLAEYRELMVRIKSDS